MLPYLSGVPSARSNQRDEAEDSRAEAQLAPLVHGDAGVPLAAGGGGDAQPAGHRVALRLAAGEPVPRRRRHPARRHPPARGDRRLVPAGVHTAVAAAAPRAAPAATAALR